MKFIKDKDVLLKIRWNIGFIKEETKKVDGSPEIKKEILDSCEILGKALSRCCNLGADKEKAREIMKPPLNEFHKIVQKIENDSEDKVLFILLITHIADIKILLSNEKD